MRARCSWAIALAVAGILTISCGIADPSKINQTETFSGTVPKGGISPGFAFTVAQTGEFTVKITALAPASSVTLFIAYSYALSDGSCSTSPQPLGDVPAPLNYPAFTGAQIYSGRYCVYVHDYYLSLAAPATFTATVSHP